MPTGNIDQVKRNLLDIGLAVYFHDVYVADSDEEVVVFVKNDHRMTEKDSALWGLRIIDIITSAGFRTYSGL